MDATTLLKEIERYLAAVALFRALGCEPTWKNEWLLPPNVGASR